jgi:hypothetical protein
MAQAILISAWLIYCLSNVIQIFRKAKKHGDNPIVRKYAKKKVVNIGIASLLYLILTVIIYVL